MNDDKRADGRQAAHHSPACSTAPNAPDKPDRPDRPGGPVRPDKSDQGTRERLLAAAAEVFAEHGYKSATVREICRRAGANVAAVNYHFGGKDNLYAAMLGHYMRTCQATYPLDEGAPPGSPPEQRLRAFVRGLVQRILGGGDDPVSEAHGKLVSLELIDPTPACDTLLREHITPVNDLLADILRGMLGARADDPYVLRTCLLAIFGHISFHYSGRAAIDHFYGREQLTPEVLERIADGVTRFTLGGIVAMAAPSRNPGEADDTGCTAPPEGAAASNARHRPPARAPASGDNGALPA